MDDNFRIHSGLKLSFSIMSVINEIIKHMLVTNGTIKITFKMICILLYNFIKYIAITKWSKIESFPTKLNFVKKLSFTIIC